MRLYHVFWLYVNISGRFLNESFYNVTKSQKRQNIRDIIEP